LEDRVTRPTADLAQANGLLARMAAIVEFSNDAIIGVTLDGAITDWNSAAGRIYGYQAAEMIGRHVSVLAPADRTDEVAGMIDRLNRDERVDSYETVRVRKTGELLDVSVMFSPIKNDAGALIGASLIIRDISGRKQAERKLHESEERFRVMADCSPVMIWVSGPDTRCNFFNKPWLEFTGRTLEQEIGHGWSEGVHPEDLQRCADIYLLAFAARKPFRMEYRLKRGDDAYRWILDIGVPRTEADGSFAGYIGSCVDITERRQSEERFRLTVEAAPNAMVMVNHQGKIVLVNAQTEEAFGYSRDELLGQSVEILVPQSYRKSHPGLRENFFAEPRGRLMGAGRDLYGQRKNGTRFPVEIGLNPIQTEEGTWVLSSIVDITERKWAETALLRLNVELEERVQQRTEIAEQKAAALEASEKEIRRSLEEKESLLGEIHHRVKNNLQVISSLLNLEAGRTQNPEVRAVCAQCQGRIQSMALIHEQLCRSGDMGKIDFRGYVECLAKETLRSSNRDPGSVSLRVEAEPVNLSLESAIPCGLIVNELLSNSLKHAFQEGSSGEVLIRFDTRDDGYSLIVDDNGRPLPADLMTREPSTMGLRLVKALTRQLDGNLRIGDAGEPKFQLTFPRGCGPREWTNKP